jgi:hypothetical protein
MPEETLAQPLSGEEVVDRILGRIREMLLKDCYLNPVAAYESFAASIQVEVKLNDCGRQPEVRIQAKVESDTPFVENENSAIEQAEAELYPAPPNQVRMDAGLPIPTLVETPEGRKEIKNIRYSRGGGKAER